MTTETMPAGVAKCPCQHCGTRIEFDLHQFQPGSAVLCPHCQMETTLFIPTPAKTAIAQFDAAAARKRRQRQNRLIILSTIGLLVVMFAYGISKVIGAREAAAGTILGVGMLFWLTLAVLSLMLVVMWILFPVFVYFSLNRQEALLRQIEQNSRR